MPLGPVLKASRSPSPTHSFRLLLFGQPPAEDWLLGVHGPCTGICLGEGETRGTYHSSRANHFCGPEPATLFRAPVLLVVSVSGETLLITFLSFTLQNAVQVNVSSKLFLTPL